VNGASRTVAAAAHRVAVSVSAVLAAVVVGAGLALIGLLGTATPAWAHATLESSSPADGAKVAKPPTRVVLTFEEPVGAQASALTVTTADGARWDAGDAEVLGSKLTASVKPGGPGGVWTVNWRVVSADGHPVSGQLHFTVTGRPAPTATPSDAGSATTPARAGPGTAVIVAIVAGVVLVLAGLAVRFGRRGRSDD
jgi:methionine-rich copper-binding protein CopC